MKIKRFKENIKNSPEIGDYIIGEVNYPEDFKPTENIINNSIGQIISKSSKYSIAVKYILLKDIFLKSYFKEYGNADDIWKENDNYYIRITLDINEIKYYSKNRNELEVILAAKNYNI